MYNLYGTDIPAAKVVERFPDRNPNPVLRMTPDGALLYGNEASAPTRSALGVDVGDPLPPPVLGALRAALADPAAPPVEVAGGGRTFRLIPVDIPTEQRSRSGSQIRIAQRDRREGRHCRVRRMGPFLRR